MCTQGRSFLSYLKNVLPICGLLLLFLVASSSGAFGLTAGPPDEKTGAPNETTCASVGCHAGNALNASGGALMLTVPETYEPGEVYTIIVDLSRAGQSKWGFQMTALDGDGARAGGFAPDTAAKANTQASETNSKQYIKHTAAGTAGANDAHKWKFQWTAPDADVGPITFYAAGNASNGNFNPIDDYIYTKHETSTPPIPVVVGVSLEIVGDAARATTDARGGVNYTLKVTNTGNMVDTITLEASAEVGIEGSVLAILNDSDRSIELEAGAAKEIAFKVAGDFFTKPGDYEITVRAMSKTDGTMTAEVTTTTTIQAPPPPPTLPKPPVPEVPITIVEPEAQPTPPIPEEAPAPEVPLIIVEPAAPPTPPTPWDVNDDGIVNIQDLVLVAGGFGQSGEALKADINGDGTVNVLDLVLVSSHFGESTDKEK